jgi:hypothetical protein
MKPTGADTKKILILAGASAALVAVIVVRFVLPGGDVSNASASQKGESRPVGVLDSDPKHLSTVARIARSRTKTVYTVSDLRDPMVPLVSAGSAQARGSDGGTPDDAAPVFAEASLPAMSLYGIIWDPENPIAMIDGMDLRVGDRIKGARITEIGFDRVTLSYRSKQFVLTVE